MPFVPCVPVQSPCRPSAHSFSCPPRSQHALQKCPDSNPLSPHLSIRRTPIPKRRPMPARRFPFHLLRRSTLGLGTQLSLSYPAPRTPMFAHSALPSCPLETDPSVPPAPPPITLRTHPLPCITLAYTVSLRIRCACCSRSCRLCNYFLLSTVLELELYFFAL